MPRYSSMRSFIRPPNWIVEWNDHVTGAVGWVVVLPFCRDEIDNCVHKVYSVYVTHTQFLSISGGLMKIIVSNQSDQPIYEQIKNQIKDAILMGELTEGEPLPSIRALANDLRVSVLTTRRVYDELEGEGFITTQAGRGSFVAKGNLGLLLETRRHMVEVKLTEAWNTARTLGISKAELFAMMELLFEEEEK